MRKLLYVLIELVIIISCEKGIPEIGFRIKATGFFLEHGDGSPITIDADYSGNARYKSNPAPGPFTELKEGKQMIKVWPRQ
jgi:hypothetical protein